MSDKGIVRLSIGKIKNNHLRRFCMLITFFPILLLLFMIGCFDWAKWYLRAVHILSKSVIDRWNSPSEN